MPLWRIKDLWESILFESVIEELVNYQALIKGQLEYLNDLIIREKQIIYT